MKLFEMTIDQRTGKLTIRHESEEKLTHKEKFILCLAAIGGGVWIAVTYLAGFWMSLWCAVIAALCIVRSYGKIDF